MAYLKQKLYEVRSFFRSRRLSRRYALELNLSEFRCRSLSRRNRELREEIEDLREVIKDLRGNPIYVVNHNTCGVLSQLAEGGNAHG